MSLKHVPITLATPPRGLRGPLLIPLLLDLRHIGQRRTQALVLNNRRLGDPPQLVVGAEGQIKALVADGQSSIRVIKHCDPLAGEGTGDLVRLENEQHLVVLKRQGVSDRALLLPGEGIIERVAWK